MTMKEDEKSEQSGKRSLERVNFVITELMTRKEAQATVLERKEAQTLE